MTATTVRITITMLIHAMILDAVTIPAPASEPLEAAIALEALPAKTNATIAISNGHTAHDRIASTSATIASDDVCGCCGCPYPYPGGGGWPPGGGGGWLPGGGGGGGGWLTRAA